MSAQSLYHTYDKKYRSLMGKFLPGEKAFDELDALGINHWKYRNRLTQWTADAIREAVYESTSANSWQEFRVSLKGMSTRLKLLRLGRRWELMVPFEMNPEAFLERCRIDNYIGALVRGGFLNKNYEVIK